MNNTRNHPFATQYSRLLAASMAVANSVLSITTLSVISSFKLRASKPVLSKTVDLVDQIRLRELFWKNLR